MARNDSLATMTVKIAANTAQFNAAVKQTQGQLKSFGDTITNTAKGFVAGFGAMQIANFTLEVSKLAGEAKGVKDAFDRLPDSVKVMRELKEATGGTVSELELMKRAVSATNFGIDLEALPKLLEFAAIRAQQTGQSVDYLVDSIVTGIGRKSPLILDNLGISTTRLKEKFGGAALEAQSIGDVAKAVGSIAEEELGKMGGFSDNAATRVSKLSAEWDNLKVVIGNSLNSVDDTKAFTLAKITADLTALFQVLQNNQLANNITANKGGLFAYLFPNVDQLFSIRELAKNIDEVKQGIEDLTKLKTDGFVKVPTLGLKIQETINKLSEENAKKEAERLAILKKINEERDKEAARVKPIRDAAAKRLEGYSFGGQNVAGFDTSQLNFSGDGSANPIAEVQNAIAEATERANQKQLEQIDLLAVQAASWAAFGISASNAIFQAIQADQDLGKSIANVTADILSSSSQRITAFLSEGIAKAFSINPIAGAAIAAVGLTVITGLLRKVGQRDNNGSSARLNSVSRERIGGQSQNSVSFVLKGQDIYGSINNYQRNNGFTTISG
jgi:hypothetical protein